MIYLRKVIKLGTSMAIIIPKPLAESMKAYKGQVMLVKMKKGKLNITAIDEHINKIEKGD